MVPADKKMALAMVNYTAAEATMWTDGSGIDGKAGAAAVLKLHGRTSWVLRYHLGTLSCNTTFDTEVVGMLLGIHLLKGIADFNQLEGVQLLLDGKSVIEATNKRKIKSRQALVEALFKATEMLGETIWQPDKLVFVWVPGHMGIDGNEEVDLEAKHVARGKSSPEEDLPEMLRNGPIPASVSALQQAFVKNLKHRWRRRWEGSP